MACSAYISYQLGGTTEGSATVQVTSRPRNKTNLNGPQPVKRTATSFVLVDPSASNSKSNGVDARKNIRKHASKACAAQRLATIAAKKKARNVLTKRERQRLQAAERLEAALQQHAHKIEQRESSEEANLQVLQPTVSFSPTSDGTVVASQTQLQSASGSMSNEVGAGATPYEWSRRRCSISWLLDPPSKALMTSGADGEPSTAVSKLESIAGVQSSRLDPFSTFPVDVEDDGSLSTLFGFMGASIFPLMDLRLVMKFDRMGSNTRHAHSKMLPDFVLSSEPLFWTMALCAATIFTLRNRQKPGAEPITMGYRYMAIRSINKRLASLGEDSIYDIGLIYAIASLGVWEREKGSKEVWVSHCQGIEMLSQKLRKASQHHLLAYIVGACNTAGSVPLEYHASEGFRRVGDGNTLDQNLISGIYECGHLDRLSSTPEREDMVQSTATKLMEYRTSDAVPRTLCGNQGRTLDGDRLNLEIHVLLQGASTSLIRHLGGKDIELVAIDMIDFDETCREAVDLGESIFKDSAYDELLLWTLFTLFALNRYLENGALEIVAKIVRRLGMGEWSQLETSLRRFVYLDSADWLYREYWEALQVHMKPAVREVLS